MRLTFLYDFLIFCVFFLTDNHKGVEDGEIADAISLIMR